MLSAPPFALFLVWFCSNVGRFHTPTDLSWSMPIAASWLVIGPVMMLWGEIGWGRTFEVLRRSAADGWDLSSIERGMVRVHRHMWSMTGGFTLIAALAFVASRNHLDALLGIGGMTSLDFWLGFLVITLAGLISGFGVWGVLKAVVFVRIATRSTVVWHPFRPPQVDGMEALGHFAYRTGLIFSAGSIFAPAIVFVADGTSTLSRVLCYCAVGILAAGGLVLFVVPAFMIYAQSERQKNAVLARYAPAVEEVFDHVLSEAGRDPTAAMADMVVLEVRREIVAATARPIGTEILRRIPATVIIPILTIVPAWVLR